MSFYFRDSPRFADRLRGMSDDELLQEVKERFNENNDGFFEPSRHTRQNSERPFSHFPKGFPFDEDTDIFERPRSDGIRAHLDDLAARHPELAEHLRGPPWPFGDSLLRDRRRRRRDSGGSSNDDQQQQSQQHQVDEDARSQASGSSAASGASAISSHSGGEPDLTSSSAIPQYGLRNTVDIGQQQRRRDMETSPEKGERNQRSMSAPPENRQQQQQQDQQQQQQPQPSQGQRFVSRVDITPQHNQQQQRAQSPGKPTSNVRHIPIFVEGRDEPVLPKVPTDFHHQQREPSPPLHFQRPSHFNDHFSRQQWPPSHFQETFYKPASFEQPIRRQQQFQQPQYHHQQQQAQQPQNHQQQTQQPQNHQQQQKQSQQEQEIPKSKPPVPKDPLEKVAEVQKEVDDLAEMVRRYTGGNRQDKEYIYLDEMLTRELIKLDDIETEGRENVRQARKNAIKTIQNTISLLETKAPLANQQKQQSAAENKDEEHRAKEMDQQKISQIQEPMDVDAKQNNEPIPLPPALSSPTPTPTKTKTEFSENESTTMAVEFANQDVAPAVQQDTERTDMDIEQKTEQKVENRAVKSMEQLVAPTSTDEVMKRMDGTSEESNLNDGKNGAATQTTTENKDVTLEQQAEEAKEEKMEVDGEQRNSMKSPMQKNAKKTKKKKQQPISEQAIPLPPPPPSTESAK